LTDRLRVNGTGKRPKIDVSRSEAIAYEWPLRHLEETFERLDCRAGERPMLDGDRSPSGKSVCSSDPRLFGHLKSIVDLNAEISNCAFKFGMAK